MSDPDELLRPSVTNPPAGPRRKPWRMQSQFWVAFLGGVVAYAVIAFLNAARLGIESRRRWWMAAATLAALAVVAALWIQRPDAPDFIAFARGARDVRIYARLAAVALFLIVRAIQKPADAHHQVFSGEYDSLWGPGLAAVFLIGTAETALLAWIGWIAHR